MKRILLWVISCLLVFTCLIISPSSAMATSETPSKEICTDSATKAEPGERLTDANFDNFYTQYGQFWQSSGNGVYVPDGYPGYLAGKTFLFNSDNKESNAILQQTFKTQPGESYTLTFTYGYLGTDNGQKLEVQVDGTAAASLLDEYVNIDSPQETYTAKFTADSDTTTLAFLDDPKNDTNYSDSWIKGVSVFGLPPQPKCPDNSEVKPSKVEPETCTNEQPTSSKEILVETGINYATNIDEILNKPVTIVNQETKRYLFSDGPAIEGNRGAEGGWKAGSGFESPNVLGADANYYNRAIWEIKKSGDSFLIENKETKRYLFSDGPAIEGNRGAEGGWKAGSGFESPNVLGADANYYNRALWQFEKRGDSFFIVNKETKRYAFSDGPKVRGNRGDEGGWKRRCFESPKVVGADANYYNRALWKIIIR